MQDISSLSKSRIKFTLILLFPLVPQILVGLLDMRSITDLFTANAVMLGIAFVLQESFRPVKLIFAGILGLFIFYTIVKWIMNSGVERLLDYLASYWIDHSLRPLTLALALITFFAFRIKRKYNFSR